MAVKALDLAIDLPEPKLIASRIYEELRNAIIQGKLKQGQRVVEDALVKTFKVSRSPVRDALRMLALDGFVEITPYRGAMISSISPREIREHFEIKAMVEGFSAWMGAERFTGEQISDLESLLAKMESYMNSSKLKGVLESNFIFHKRIVDNVCNKKLSRYYESLNHSIRRYGTIGLTDHFIWDVSLHEHQQILEAIKAKNSLLAEEESRLHALNTMERVLLKLSPDAKASETASLNNEN